MLKSAELKEYAKSIGVDLIGIAPVSRIDDAPTGHRPNEFLPGCESIISLGFKLNRGTIKGIPRTRDQYMLEFTHGNSDLYRMSYQITRYIEDKGFDSVGFTPDLANTKIMKADISHRHAAVACGLGKFGLHELLITPQYRSRVRLSTVITESKFDRYDDVLQENICDFCGKCIKACPVNALKSLDSKEFNHSIGYTIEKEKCKHYQDVVLEGRRCGICVKTCSFR